MNFLEVFPFVSFLLFTALLFGRVFFLKRKGIKISAKSPKAKKIKFILHPVFLVVMHLWMFEISRPVLHLSLLPEVITKSLFVSLFLQIAGVVFILFSIVILSFTLLHFQKSFRFGMNAANQGNLITNGIFSLTRNPFFLSIELLLLGNAMVFPSSFLIGFALLAVISIHFFILKEEKFMQANYGDEYKNYTAKVRRYF